MRHQPVLLNETLHSLQLKRGMKIVDCTLGDAGHTEKILELISPEGKLLGIDADKESIERAKNFLASFKSQIILEQSNFIEVTKIVEKYHFFTVDGIVLDLGWSLPQFKERGRGFSFEHDEPLDMRYDVQNKNLLTAAVIISTYTKKELENIFRMYGEEKLSKEIAVQIVEEREKKVIDTTLKLVEIILKVYRQKLNSTKQIPWIGGIHPATKVFQALRIEVNKELEVLKKTLPQLVDLLHSKGRLAVITFHSLEDRIVKQFFKKIAQKKILIINKKPIIATHEELLLNPRARSAKLRVVEKI